MMDCPEGGGSFNCQSHDDMSPVPPPGSCDYLKRRIVSVFLVGEAERAMLSQGVLK